MNEPVTRDTLVLALGLVGVELLLTLLAIELMAG